MVETAPKKRELERKYMSRETDVKIFCVHQCPGREWYARLRRGLQQMELV